MKPAKPRRVCLASSATLKADVGRHQTEVTIMRERRQEKIGWVGGWLGGFVWVLLLSVMLLARGACVFRLCSKTR